MDKNKPFSDYLNISKSWIEEKLQAFKTIGNTQRSPLSKTFRSYRTEYQTPICPTKTAERCSTFQNTWQQLCRTFEHYRNGTKVRKTFSFANFVEYLAYYITNSTSCLQVKPVRQTSLRPPLQSVAIQQSLYGDMLRVDLVGELKNFWRIHA